MEKVQFPRFMVAAEKSGQGKTLITCALLELLKEQHRVSAFKCGPDYIDPMFHRRVAGVPSYNLDSFFSSREELIQLLGLHGGPDRLGVIEGVMGYYDGLGGSTDRASSYEVAERTHTPVILVADAQGRSFSTLAAVRGFLSFRPDSHIKGVLFNRLSPMLYPALKRAAEEELGIRAVGFVPPLGEEFQLKSRHLGLLRPEEIPGFREEIHRLAETLRPGIDLEAILSIAKEAEPLPARRRSLPQIQKKNGEKPVIAVAMDEAFCFYYQDNLETLEAMNAELRFFSPIHDEKVPGEADGLYLGGGYPELFRKRFHAGQRPGTPGPGDTLHRRMRRIPVSEAGACGCGRHLLAHVRCASRGKPGQRKAFQIRLRDHDGHGRQCPGACRDQRSGPRIPSLGQSGKRRLLFL